ncbi:MAG: hypothetical protein PPFGHCPK_00396 [Spiroplasma endosymbiont of Drosophila atripex]|nr:MAG: hypothetical protein PPFGHCPK_00396 [Spiroplasma endosymbiont of Drosophila atripex]
MSEEKKKKKKKKAIIAGIIGSVALIGGGVGGIIATIPETEAKNEEENEEEKKKPPTSSPKSQPISKVELATALPQNQRNLGTIETNGQDLNEQMIKDKLPENVKEQVDIRIIDNSKATVSAKTGANAKYKGTPITIQFEIDKSVELNTAFTDSNLGTIETNGQDLNEQMIKDKLPENVKEQVDIRIIDNSKATVSAKTGANAKYKGNSVTVTFTVDSKVELATAQSDVWSLATDNNGNIYAGDKNGNVYKNGQIIIKINFSVWSLATDNNGNIYAGTSQGKIYKINNTSQSKWTKTEVHDLKLQVTSLATDNNGNIYSGDKNGNVYKNGQIIIKINSAVREIITDNNWNIYAGTLNGKIYKINNTSQSKWTKTEVHDLKLQVTSLATDNNWNIYAGTLNGKIYKINNTSQSKWTKTEVHDLKLQVTSLATDNNGNIYAGTSQGKIYKL